MGSIINIFIFIGIVFGFFGTLIFELILLSILYFIEWLKNRKEK